ncbi:hypothetical protein WN51_04115 [Melipona quadrifasciata]|uniref:Uncharacterized protein n=1 Tax=Melipona quadrifasciata TaxID=166423 RepID=A0A0M8ZSI0_9HYME|nr:hypothetical protein WN51_04115 [Melipona quadrifasciata]
MSEQNQTALYPVELVDQSKTPTDNNYISPIRGYNLKGCYGHVNVGGADVATTTDIFSKKRKTKWRISLARVSPYNYFIIESDFSGGNSENRTSSGATLMQRKLAIGRFGSRDSRRGVGPRVGVALSDTAIAPILSFNRPKSSNTYPNVIIDLIGNHSETSLIRVRADNSYKSFQNNTIY